jgi:putative transposase
MARRAGWQVNNKRIRRLWREEGLRVPQRRRKKRLTGIGVAVGAMSPIRPNVIWTMDFQFDTTADGRTIKMLNVIDEFTREALAIEVDRAIDADGVVDVLDRLVLTHGSPHFVRFDNGPEFVAHAVSWCRFNSAGSLFIDPGSPWQNAWIESFNGWLRDELLNSWRFDSLREARVIIEAWRCRLQRQPAPLRSRRTHSSRVRSTVDHDPPTPSRIATGPPSGSPSPRPQRRQLLSHLRSHAGALAAINLALADPAQQRPTPTDPNLEGNPLDRRPPRWVFVAHLPSGPHGHPANRDT